MDSICCAVIGTGHLGKHHTRILSQFSGVELVGVCDIREESLKTVSTQFNAKEYRDYKDLIKEVDAVVVATPTVTHHEVCMAFLDAGKHVLVEKPISTTLDEAEKMVETARKKECIFQVGHSERFNPAFIAAQPFVKNPRFIETHRLNMFAPRGIDVDVVLDLMIHDLDIILHFMNAFPARIDSIGVPVLSKEIDIANTRLTFPGGAVANITASRVSVNPIRKFRIFQEDTYISIDFKDPNVSIYKRNPPLEGSDLPQIQRIPVEIAKQEPLFMEISDFINSIRTGTEPKVTGEVGLKALKAALMVLKGVECY
ncbi:MAG: hypothetical protein A2161_13055 [Candidatus Schekmanbacteria bacterium RBG_13_48_7]|uniref:Gfo/Idh/MocA-like oxidoreductase N-terminal domain-containing protein n=1 Tax=Candidatus Schekmanbacteria bacterium RBG_13_48_7 TaxID=1817878 RepID=A0A1F7RJB3_9BACT|nr:MAG: hypothetical protein A2161_13055 [Candidatus Schekmanbacteria bacterium RBG_13_48_7]